MKLFIALALAVLVGCQSMPAPKSTAQQIAYAQATLTGLANTALSLINTGVMSKEEGRKVLKSVFKAQDSIDLARILLGQNKPDDAVAQLQLVQKILIELNAHLAEREQK